MGPLAPKSGGSRGSEVSTSGGAAFQGHLHSTPKAWNCSAESLLLRMGVVMVVGTVMIIITICLIVTVLRIY